MCRCWACCGLHGRRALRGKNLVCACKQMGCKTCSGVGSGPPAPWTPTAPLIAAFAHSKCYFFAGVAGADAVGVCVAPAPTAGAPAASVARGGSRLLRAVQVGSSSCCLAFVFNGILHAQRSAAQRYMCSVLCVLVPSSAVRQLGAWAACAIRDRPAAGEGKSVLRWSV